jgi:hypothetical protein
MSFKAGPCRSLLIYSKAFDLAIVFGGILFEIENISLLCELISGV